MIKRTMDPIPMPRPTWFSVLAVLLFCSAFIRSPTLLASQAWNKDTAKSKRKMKSFSVRPIQCILQDLRHDCAELLYQYSAWWQVTRRLSGCDLGKTTYFTIIFIILTCYPQCFYYFQQHTDKKKTFMEILLAISWASRWMRAVAMHELCVSSAWSL